MELREVIIFGAVPLLGFAALWLIALGGKYLRAKVDNLLVRQALLLLAEASRDAVMEVKQTIADKAKEANADGKLTDEEVAEIRAAALEVLKLRLGSFGRGLISKVFGLASTQLDTFLMSKNESTFSEIKNDPLA